jgi:hypothetical protein
MPQPFCFPKKELGKPQSWSELQAPTLALSCPTSGFIRIYLIIFMNEDELLCFARSEKVLN